MQGLRPRESNFAVALYFLFKIIPSLGAILSIYLGYRLFILGVTGQASLSVDTHSIKGQLINAAPGLFFAIAGVVVMIAVVWKTVNLGFDDDGGVRLLYDSLDPLKSRKSGERILPDKGLSA